MRLRLIRFADWIDVHILHHKIPLVCSIIWDWQLKYEDNSALDEMARQALKDHREGKTEDMNSGKDYPHDR